MHLLHMNANAKAVDGREMPLMIVISETLKYISNKAIQKLKEQVFQFIMQAFNNVKQVGKV